MNIQHTNAFDANILKKVMHIESKIYPPELRGTWTAACARFKKFPNYLITVHNNNDVVGYLCYIPVSDTLYTSIIKSTELLDDNIEAKDIDINSQHWFILSVGIDPAFQKQGLGADLMHYLLSIKPKHINTITAFCCTKGGLDLAKKFGFTIINFTPEGYCSVQRRE